MGLNSARIWARQITEDMNARLARVVSRWLRKTVDLLIGDLELMGALKNFASSAELPSSISPRFRKDRDQL